MEEDLSRLDLNDDGSESDDELQEQGHVDLGFVQEPDHPWVLERQHFPCKAGGVPAWLDPVNLPQMKDAGCGICEEPLQFLLQVSLPFDFFHVLEPSLICLSWCKIYASLDERDDTFHRTLFIFMCSKMECLRKDQDEQRKGPCRSIKVFRSQLPRKNAFYSDKAPSEKDLPLREGVELCNWCGTWRGEKVCGGCKAMRYCSRKHQIEHWRAGHSSSCKRPNATVTTKVQASESNSVGRKYLSNKLWREFEIVMDEEGSNEDDDSQAENPLQIVPTQSKTGESEALTKELQGFEEASKEKQCWASFQARIGRAPSQILRYCRTREAKPLWMRLDGQPQSSDILPCHLCGGPRIFEFQVLPQLLYFFGVENEPDSLDWGSIAVYSCADSCSVKGYAEEFPWVQLSS